MAVPSVRNQYDGIYGHRELPSNLDSSPMIKSLAEKLPQGAKVLDLGCGIGEVSLYLALHGKDLEVTGVDISPVGIEKAKELAQRNNAKVTYQTIDFSSGDFESQLGQYDVILCLYALQYLTPDEVKSTIGMIQRHTKPGGCNFITSFLAKTPEDKKAWQTARGGYLFDGGELKGLYSGWSINKNGYREFKGPPEWRENLPPQWDNNVRLLAYKK